MSAPTPIQEATLQTPQLQVVRPPSASTSSVTPVVADALAASGNSLASVDSRNPGLPATGHTVTPAITNKIINSLIIKLSTGDWEEACSAFTSLYTLVRINEFSFRSERITDQKVTFSPVQLTMLRAAKQLGLRAQATQLSRDTKNYRWNGFGVESSMKANQQRLNNFRTTFLKETGLEL